MPVPGRSPLTIQRTEPRTKTIAMRRGSVAFLSPFLLLCVTVVGSDNDDDLDVETQNKFYEAEEIVDDGNGDREKLAEAITLRDLLRAKPISASVCVNGSKEEADGHFDLGHCDHHFEDLHVGDEQVEWEHGRSKDSDFQITPPDNVRIWRHASFGIGALMCSLRRASERVYAPGGAGVEGLRREFEALQAGQQASGEGEA